jgi:hypothetical protein
MHYITYTRALTFENKWQDPDKSFRIMPQAKPYIKLNKT